MINLFVKGFFIGVGKVLPGVSGSMLAITFGIYDKIIEIMSYPLKNIKKNILFLFPICLGFLLAIIITSIFLKYLILKYYNIVIFCFIGLISRGIYNLKKEIDFNKKNIIITIISFLIVFSLKFINNSFNIINYSFISIFFLGIIEAFTSIVPGISGTAIFMILDCYEFVLTLFSHYFIISYLKYTIPFLFGIIFGLIIISRIIHILLKRNKSELYSSIIGFTIGSIIILFLTIKIDNLYSLIIGIILFLLSFTLLTKK